MMGGETIYVRGNKGLSRNDVIVWGEAVSQKVTKSDQGEGGVSHKVTVLNKSD